MSKNQEEKLIIEEHFSSIIDGILTKSIPAEPNIGELPGLFDGSEFYGLPVLQEKYGGGWPKISEVLKKYLTQKRGKRIRPILFLLGYKIFSQNKKIEQETAEVAVGIEMLHEAALIIDDIMDNSLLRRGAPSLWSAIEIGAGVSSDEAKKIAANLGALCFSWSRYLIIDKSEESVRTSAGKVFWDTVNNMKRGQVMDVNSTATNKWPELEESLEWEHLKTATYSTELPLLLSLYLAEAGDAQEVVVNGIRVFARGFGLAFQLKDDLLILKLDEEIGKESIADAVNGNKIPLAILARQLCNNEQKVFIDSVWGKPEELNTENIKKLKDIFIETGAVGKIEQRISSELKNAKNGLGKIKELGFNTDSLDEPI